MLIALKSQWSKDARAVRDKKVLNFDSDFIKINSSSKIEMIKAAVT